MDAETNSAAAEALEIVNTRVFDVSRERLFNAFRDPACLAAWWGPQGFTNTMQQFDLRPGGTWRLEMRGPEGAIYPNVSTFLEVVEAELNKRT